MRRPKLDEKAMLQNISDFMNQFGIDTLEIGKRKIKLPKPRKMKKVKKGVEK